ncbi:MULTISPECIES: hypothetical protein [Spirulina sp. CCY15215]|uniref:hypothetical protein n=1 Tax=Spirulina sp. CCY15215 TaxID=2767591 RepID=UPI00194F2E52|nr:hypothetical protein [Spirulina major]
MILFLIPNAAIRVAIASSILVALTGIPALAQTRSETNSEMPVMHQHQEHQMMGMEQIHEKMAEIQQIMEQMTPEQMRELHPLISAHNQKMMEQMQQFIEQMQRIRDRDVIEHETEN